MTPGNYNRYLCGTDTEEQAPQRKVAQGILPAFEPHSVIHSFRTRMAPWPHKYKA